MERNHAVVRACTQILQYDCICVVDQVLPVPIKAVQEFVFRRGGGTVCVIHCTVWRCSVNKTMCAMPCKLAPFGAQCTEYLLGIGRAIAGPALPFRILVNYPELTRSSELRIMVAVILIGGKKQHTGL